MPPIVRFIVLNWLIGFAVGVILAVLLLITNTANLKHLILTSDVGWIAFAMLAIFNGLVCAGVQAAIRVMLLRPEDPPTRGKPAPLRPELVMKAAGPPGP